MATAKTKKNESTDNAKEQATGKGKRTTANSADKVEALPATEVKVDPLADLKQAYAQNNDALALQLGANHLAATPDDINVLKILARIHNRQQNWAAARDTWLKLVALEPLNFEPPLQVARIALRNKKNEEALTNLDKVLALSPTHEEASLSRLNLLITLGNMPKAIETARLFKASPVKGSCPALVKLAKLLFEKHQQQGDALEIASIATESDQDNADALKLRSKILATLQTDAIAAHLEGDEEEAAKACRDIQRSFPQHERAAAILKEIVRPLLLQAREQYKAERHDAAISGYESILAIDPNHAESLRSLARLHTKAQNEAVAEQYWLRLEAAAPTESEASLQVARLRAKANDNEAALLRYARLATLPGNYQQEALTNRERMAARVVRDAGIKARDLELDEAFRLCEIASKLETLPEKLPEVRARIEVLSAREAAHAFKAQDNAAAVAHAKRALKINPANERALLILARAAHKVQDYRSALDAWRGVSAIQPENSEAWLQKARYYLRFREYGEAITASRRLQELDPSHPEATTIRETATVRLNEPRQ